LWPSLTAGSWQRIAGAASFVGAFAVDNVHEQPELGGLIRGVSAASMRR